MKLKTQNGFTLVELVVALAVAGILLGVGVPSFIGAIKNSQVGSDRDLLTQALFLARSESVKSKSFVTVCPKQSPESQQCATNVNQWQYGLLVFIDEKFTNGEAAATVDSEDTIIFTQEPQRSDNTVSAIGSVDGSAATATPRAYIRYSSTGNGTSDWGNGSFLMCNDDEASLSRVMNIAPTGDIRPGRASGSDYPRDVFNREACKL